MQIIGQTKRLPWKTATKLFGAILLAAGPIGPLSAGSLADLSLVYDANFDNGSLGSAVDPMGFGPLQLGDSQTAGANPSWSMQNGELLLGVTQPVGVNGVVSAGAFARPVNFAMGSVFGMRATFVAPIGPHAAGNVWAVVLGARTGDQDDLFAETRAAATLQIRGNGARLNTPGSSVPAGLPNLPQAVYDAIFDPDNPQIFTLELFVDRIAGAGNATLRTGNSVFSHDFQFAAFRSDSGPAITAIGPSLAISNAPGQSASLRVLGFQVFAPVPEPSAWMMMMFGFGLVGFVIRYRGGSGEVKNYSTSHTA